MRTILVTMMVVTGLTSPGSAMGSTPEFKTETRSISAFHAVDVSGGVELTVRQGDGPSVSLTGEPDVLANYRSEVTNGVLVIAPRERRGWARHTVRVAVTTSRIDSLSASGGVRVTLESGTSKTLAVEASGGTVLIARSLDLDSLKLEASGGVKLELEGHATEAHLEVSGGVKLDARGLSTARASLEASGGCKVSLTAHETISGSVSGGVSVEVLGRPPSHALSSSGAASVVYLD